MNLTGGYYKGRKITVPENTKPTLSKVRESVFNILRQYKEENAVFLDMFAGSGIMGLEAVSRGYKVKELEISKKTAQIIKQNYKSLGLSADIEICNSLKYEKEKFDIIYLDPPWQADYGKILNHTKKLLNTDGIIVVEYDQTRNLDISEIIRSENLPFTIIKSKKYGRCMIDVLMIC